MRALAATVFVVLSACASGGAADTSPTRTVRVVDGSGGTVQLSTAPSRDLTAAATLAYPHDQVWRALPAVYDALGIPVSELSTAASTIGNPGFRARRRLGDVPLIRYLECGRTQDGPNAETYELHVSIVTQVRPADAMTTTVATTLQATARPVGVAGNSVQCVTKGDLESRIVQQLRRQLQG